MAVESQNWKREYLKSRAEVKSLKSELNELRASSNAAAELSEMKNEIAALREDINALTELVKEFFAVDHEHEPEEPDELPQDDEDDKMKDDPVFKKVREVLAYHLDLDKDEIEPRTDFYAYGGEFQDAMNDLSNYYGIEIPYNDYTKFYDVADIVNYINEHPPTDEDKEDGTYSYSSYSGSVSDYDHHDARTTTTIENRTGIHARPASLFVQTASQFRSKIQISAKGKTVDAKSILMIMSMGLCKGTEVTITADGYDALEAVLTLKKLIDDKFGEE